jgi:ubiquinone/menaquinone biosynthesis C-methylase UbiE
MDSPFGLIASSVLSPLYLYASLKGKFDAWDKLLDELPSGIFSSSALDIGCGRGLVLLKIAQRKKALSAQSEAHSTGRAYGVDLFIKADQSGNSAEATYDNGANLELLDYLVLHTADFTQLPFQDESMALVTASLSIHNADKVSRKKAHHRGCTGSPTGRVWSFLDWVDISPNTRAS